MRDFNTTILPIRLPIELKKTFKLSAKNAGFTMQDVAMALIESYVESPDSYKINKVRIEVSNAQPA